MKLTVDRIENDIAIVETESGELLSVPAVLLGDIKEGDKLTLTVEKDKTDTTDTHSIFEKLRNKSNSK